MTRAAWITLYVGAVIAALVMQLATRSVVSRATGVLPFAVLMTAAIGTSRPGRWPATAGMLLAAISPVLPALWPGSIRGWFAAGCLLIAAAALIVAFIRSGLGAHGLARGLAMAGAVVAMLPLAMMFVSAVPAARRPVPSGCVDTCWGHGLDLVIATALEIEVAALILVAVSIATHRVAGAGALAVVIAEQVVWWGSGQNSTSPGHMAFTIVLYAGFLLTVDPWTGLLPTRLSLVRMGPLQPHVYGLTARKWRPSVGSTFAVAAVTTGAAETGHRDGINVVETYPDYVSIPKQPECAACWRRRRSTAPCACSQIPDRANGTSGALAMKDLRGK